MQQRGFIVLEQFLPQDYCQRVLSEALRAHREAYESNVPCSDVEELRGGSPARRFLSASGGPLQHAYYSAPRTALYLSRLAGAHVRPTSERGTYSYYARAGDFLAIHRDVELCDLAVITCLHDGPNQTSSSGVLHLYPDRTDEPLSAVRSDPSNGAVSVRLRPGQTIIFFGGLIPHAILPVTAHQVRIVSVLCFQVGNDPPEPRTAA